MKRDLPKKISSNKLLKISEAAKKVGASPDTLRRWEKEGKITPIRTKGGTRLYPDFVKIGKAAKTLGVSIDTLRRWERSGKITTIRTPGGTRLYSLDNLQKINPFSKVKTPQTVPKTTSDLLENIEEVESPLKDFQKTPYLTTITDLSPPQLIPPTIIKKIYATIYARIYASRMIFQKNGFVFFLFTLIIMASLLIGVRKFGSNLSFQKPVTSPADVLAITSSSKFLEVNSDTQINGALSVRDSINELLLEATPSAGTFALSSGDTQLSVTNDALIDQDVSTAASPTFNALNLSSTNNQLIFQSGGPTGTLTWTPTTNQVINLPDLGSTLSTTLVGTNTTQTLTNKTISGSSNTLSNIPNSALSNSKVTVTAGTNLSGGGDVSLGSSITINLKDSVSLASTLAVTGATTLSSTVTVSAISSGSGSTVCVNSSNQLVSCATGSAVSGSGTTNYISKFTSSSAIGNSSIFDNGNVGIGTSAPSQAFQVNINTSNPFVVTSTGNLGIGFTSPNSALSVGSANQFTVNTSGNLTRINNIPYSFPSSQAVAANYVLANDSSGNLSWAAVAGVGGVSGTGNSGGVTYWTGTSTVSDSIANFYWDSTNNRLGIGNSSPQYRLDVNGTGYFSGFVGIGSSLNVSGNVGIGQSLTVTSGTSLSTLNTTGLANLASLNVTGISNLTGNVGIGASLTTTGLGVFNGGLNVSGLSNLTGNVGIGGSLTVTSAPVFSALGLGVVQSNATGALSSGPINLASSNFVSGILPVANGGTGAGTFTSNGVLYGNGTSAIQVTAAGGTNSVLTANGGAPSFSSTPTLSSLTLAGNNSALSFTGTTPSISSNTSLSIFPQGGNVGIGTSTTSYLLDVAGTGRFTGFVGIGSSLNVSGNVGVGQSLTVSSGTVLQGGLAVTGGSVVLPAGSINNSELENSAITVTATAGTGISVSGSPVSLGGTLTVAGIDASDTVKGVASFNSTNFSVSSGAVNTIQDISTSSSPSFNNLTLSGNLGVGGSLVVTGNVGIGKSLSVTDLGVFNKGINVSGLANLTGNVGIGGTATFNSLIQGLSGLTVSGFTNLSDTRVTTLTATGNTSLNSAVSLTGLTSGTGNALCLNSSNNMVTCTVGTGGASATGGQINGVAFFDTTSDLTSNVANFYWDSTNNRLGIGTSAPQYKLDVAGTGYFSGFVGIGSSLNVSGNVGIGNSLTVSSVIVGSKGLVITGTGAFSSTVSGADAVSSNEFVTLSQLQGGTGSLWQDGGDYLNPNSSFATSVRIPAGNLGIGTSATSGSTLQINGNGVIGWGTAAVAGPVSGLAVYGNVGIGTTSPGAALEVAGQVKITGGSPGLNKVLTSDATGLATWTTLAGAGGITGSGTIGFIPVFDSTSSITNSTTLWNSGGNVGIGTTSPSQTFQINYSSANPVVVTSAGNVGIGFTTPDRKLQIGADITGLGNALGTILGAGGSQLDLTGSTANTLNKKLALGIDTTNNVGFIQAGASLGVGTTAAYALSLNPLAGNVGIGTTSPGSKVDISGDASLSSTASALRFSETSGQGTSRNWLIGNGSGPSYGDLAFLVSAAVGGNPASGGTQVMTLTGGGNVGIGATTSSNKLDVWGNSRIAGTLTVDSTGTFGAGLIGYSGVSAPASGLAISGNLGVGTTSPAGALHVVGQCVAWDSKIRIRRRKRKGSWTSQDDILEYDYLEVMIKDILPGDEVLSLNEYTQEFEYQKVEKLLDMGLKGVYELTTKSGKKIKTTGNHPYLTMLTSKELASRSGSGPTFEVVHQSPIKDAGWVKVVNLKAGDQIAVAEGLSFGTGRLFTKDVPDYSKGNYSNSESYLSQSDLWGQVYHISSSISSVDTASFQEIIANNIFPVNIIGSLEANMANNQAATKLEQTAEKILNWGTDGSKERFITQNSNTAPDTYQWPASRSLDVGWDEIVSIKYLGYEHVYDLQIENTHNFVGNDIVAHNTFITGNLGIGATTSANKLDVWGNSRIAGTLTVDSTSTFGGNLTLSSGQFLAPNGTSSLPSYSFTNSTSTGMYSPSANALALVTNGASTPALTITAGGNVGIGNTSPSAPFNLATNNANVSFGSVASGYGSISFASTVGLTNYVLAGNTSETILNTLSSTPLKFAIGNSVVGKFDSAGNLGVGGNNDADYRLEVYDSTNTPAFALSDDDVAHGVTTLAQTDTFLHLSSISTTVGGARITALADADGQALELRAIQSSNPTDSTPAIKLVGAKASGTGVQDLAATETILQIANNDEAAALTILGNGNLGIGTTNPSQLFQINNNTSSPIVITSAGNVGIGFTSPSNTFTAGASNQFQIDSTGNLRRVNDVPYSFPSAQGANNTVLTNDSVGNLTWSTVAGVGGITGTGNTGGVTYWTGTSTVDDSVANFYWDSTNNRLGIGTSAPSQTFQVNTNTASPFVVTSGGNLGVGFTTPDRLLQIGSDINIVGSNASLLGTAGTQFAITGGTANNLQKKLVLGIDTTDNYGVIQAGAVGTNYNLSLNPAGGNVGIGQTSPADRLHIGGFLRTDDVAWASNNDFGSDLNVVLSMAVFNGKLYAGMGSGWGDADVFVYDGTTWTLSNDPGAGARQTKSLAVYNGKLYAGTWANGNDYGDAYVYNGSTWSLSNDFGTAIEEVNTFAVYNGKLYAGVGSGGGDVEVHVYDGSTWSLSNDFGANLNSVYALAVYNGKLYAGVGGGTAGAGVYVYDGSTWSLSNDFGADTDSVSSLAVYNGKLYAGTSIGNAEVHVYDGSTWSTSTSLGASYGAATDLAVYNGKLYAGTSTDGDVYVYDGSSWSLSYNQGGSEVGALAVYNGKLYAGGSNTTPQAYVYSERLESQLAKEFNPAVTTPFNEQYQHFLKDITMSGNLGIGGSLVVTGNVGIGKSLNVTDLGVFNKGINVTGLSNLTGNVGIGGSLTVTSAPVFSSLGLGVVQSNATGALSSGPINLASSNFVSGILPVANGGTGVGTFTSNGVLYGNGTSAIQVTAQGGTNSVLTANGGAPSFSSTPTLSSLTLAGNNSALSFTGTTPSISSNTSFSIFPQGGNVGIGTSGPLYGALTVKGVGTGTGIALQTYSGSSLTQGLTVLDNGNVGIGTTSPTYKLDIFASDSPFRTIQEDNGTNDIQTGIDYTRLSTGTAAAGFGYRIRLNLEDSAGNTDNAAAFGAVWTDATSDSEDAALFFQTRGPNGTALTERVRIDSNGNVGIGTSTPNSKLAVVGNAVISQSWSGLTVPTSGLLVEGNVGIGATTSNNKLDVWGGARITSGLTLEGLSSAAATALCINSSNQVVTCSGSSALTGTGVSGGVTYWNGTSSLSNSVANFYWDSTNNRLGVGNSAPSQAFQVNTNTASPFVVTSGGNLGIGFTTPDRLLQIGSDINIVGSNASLLGAAGSQFAITGSSGTGGTEKKLVLGIDTTDNYGVIQAGHTNGTNYNLALNPAGGNVGIGITSPLQPLHVQASGNTSVPFVITSTGNVGIGFSSPTAQLDVANVTGYLYPPSSNATSIIKIRTTTSGVYDFADLIVSSDTVTTSLVSNSSTSLWNALDPTQFAAGATLKTNGSGGLTLAASNAAGVIHFFSGGTTERARLDTSGNLGIGTTTPNSKLAVVGNAVISQSWSGLTVPTSGLLVEGNVGIGATTSNNKLDVWGGANVTGNLGIGASLTTTGLGVFNGGINVSGLSNLTGNVGIGGSLTVASAPVFSALGLGVVQSNVSGALSSGPINLASSSFVSGILPVANGGTGADTFTSNGVLYGNGTSAIQVTAQGGTNSVLTANGGAPSFSSTPTLSSLTLAGNNNALSFTGSTPSISSNTSLSIFPQGGNVGIGTSGPLYGALTVKGLGTGTGIALQTYSGSSLTQGLTVLDNGNVGIGTTTPSAMLHLESTTAPGIRLNQIGTAGDYTLGFYGSGANVSTDFNITSGTGSLYAGTIIRSGGSGETISITSNTGGAAVMTSGGTGSKTLIIRAIENQTGNLLEWQNSSSVGLGAIDVRGNLGIGTTSPQAKLVIQGNVGIGYTGANQIIPSNGLAVFGNVGIGTTTANSNLSVSGSAHIGGLYQGISAPANGLFVDGNVGIGATTSDNKLDVWGGARITSGLTLEGLSSAAATALCINSSNQIVTCSGSSALTGTGASGGVTYWTGSGTLSNSVANFYWDSTNNRLGIGTSSPQYRLDVTGTGYFSGFVGIGSSLNVAGNVGVGQSLTVTSGVNLSSSLNVTGNTNLTTLNATGLNITNTSNTVAALSLTNNTATTIGNGGNTLGVLDLQSTSLTTGNFLNIELNGLSSGKGLNLTSTSTALSSGTLLNLDWSPTTATTATGDLLNIGIGVSGTIGNLLNIQDTGSSIFSVSESSFITSLPASFTAAGDVSIAYDINMTNPTASYIKSNAPLYITAGKVFNSSDLTLTTYNQGQIFLNSTAGVYAIGNVGIGVSMNAVTLPSNGMAVQGNVGIGASTANSTLSVAGSAHIGSTRQGIAAPTDGMFVDGNVGIGATTSNNKLDVWGNARITGTLTVDSTATVGTLNATSAIQLGSANINTAGTLSNVAYLNQANAFTANQNFNAGFDVDDAFVVADGGALTTSQSVTLSGSNNALVFTGSTPSISSNTSFSIFPQAGNVGIGTSTTSYLLDVAGTGRFTGFVGIGSSLNVSGNVGIGQSLTVTSGTSLSTLNTTGLANLASLNVNGTTSITDNSNTIASLSLTNNTATTIGNGGNTLGVIDLGSTSLTTGNFMNIELNGLSTGKGINLTSTSTALTTGNLMSIDWSPGSATTATSGDLFKITIGTNGTLSSGNLFNIVDTTTSIFSVSESSFITSLPASFNAAGDVSIAYDINMTNPTASYIKSAAPLYIVAGEVFNSSDLILQTYNSGNLILNPSSWNLWADGTNVGIGTSGPVQKFQVNASGTSSFVVSSAGNVGIGTTTTGVPLTINGLGTTSGTALVVDSSGQVYKTSSSQRYKDNIQNLNDNFNKILEVQPKSFNYKDTGAFDVGYIAEDLDAMGLKNLVIYDNQGRPDSIKYDRLALYTIEILKDQQTTLSNLTSTLTTTGRITSGTGLDSPEVNTGLLNFGLATIASSSGNLAIQFSADSVAGVPTAFQIKNSLGQNLFQIDASGAAKLAGTLTTEAGAFDVAEEYEVADDSIEAGDVVSITSGVGLLVPEVDSAAVQKSSKPYDSSIIGIVSTKPGITLANTPGESASVGTEPTPGVNGGQTRPVTLNGRVPVKVSTENGPISVGDFLTSSSTPGVAMKATKPGQVVGKALEEFDENTPGVKECSYTPGVNALCGKILVFINVSFADPGNFLASLRIDDQGNLIIPKLKAESITLDPSIASTSTTLNVDASNQQLTLSNDPNYTSPGPDLASNNNSFIDLAGEIASLEDRIKNQELRIKELEEKVVGIATPSASLTAIASATPSATLTHLPGEVAPAVHLEGVSEATSSTQVAGVQTSTPSATLTHLPGETEATSSGHLEGVNSELNLTPPDILLTTHPAQLVNLEVTSDATISGMLTAYDLNIQNSLKSFGNTTLGSTMIAGDLTVDGMLTLTGNSLSTLSTLYIQNSSLAGPVDFFNGLVTIDKTGKVLAQEIVTKTVTTDKLVINNTPGVSPGSPGVNASIGSDKIAAGTTKAAVLSNRILQSSKIFITPRSSTSGQAPFVELKEEGVGFVVSIDQAISRDIDFDWWIVETR